VLSPTDRITAPEFRRRVAAVVRVRQVWVFGSRARGDAEQDADLDVFVEVEDVSPEQRQRISDLAWEVGSARDLVISTTVSTRAHLEEGPIGASPLVLNVRREGVPV